MAIEMKSISNYDYLRYMTAASREISDEPSITYLLSIENQAYIIDPGDVHDIMGSIKHDHLELKGILLTHGISTTSMG
jgi:glyoxylase-like metal-dependent hydrolase (beta-lactamase superfamily II)